MPALEKLSIENAKKDKLILFRCQCRLSFIANLDGRCLTFET